MPPRLYELVFAEHCTACSSASQPRQEAVGQGTLDVGGKLVARGNASGPQFERVYASVVVRARAVLAVSLLLVGASLVATVLWLGFRTSRLDLLNPRSEYNRRWLAYLDEFGRDDDAVVVVEGPDAATVVKTVDRLCTAIEKEPHNFHTVLSKISVESLRNKALHYLSTEQLQGVVSVVEDLRPVIAGNWNQLEISTQLQRWNDMLEQSRRSSTPGPHEAAAKQLAARLTQLLDGLANALDGTPSSPTAEAPLDLLARDLITHDSRGTLTSQHDGHLLFNDGRTGILLVRLTMKPTSQLAHGSAAVVRLRDILHQDQIHHPDVTIGLTGLPILENDEMNTSQQDMLFAGLVSLLGVAALFVAGFGGIRLPLLTVAALLVGMAWSFGYVTLAIGHLNILSISFGVILIGLGIDFGIHYVARYAQLRTDGASVAEALPRTASGVGPGIITGGVTTALAFFTAALTQFTGVAELGVIAGGGILLTIVAALTVLPVLIRLAEPDEAAWRPPRPLPFAALCIPCTWTPRLAIVVVVAATSLLAVGVTRLRYDHNLLNLQAEGLDSVTWEHRLLDSSDRSVWFAVSLADSREELFRKKERFEQLASVHHTEEIASLLPPESSAHAETISRLHERLSALPEGVPLLPVAPRAILLGELQRTDSLAQAIADGDPAVALTLQRIREALNTRPWPTVRGSSRSTSKWWRTVCWPSCNS